jgi:hypothetical protein
MLNAGTLWRNADHAHRLRLQAFFFPAGLTWPVEHLEPPQAALSSVSYFKIRGRNREWRPWRDSNPRFSP